ncbi:MAG: thiamine-phosphate kinase [Proteobacteria bacterium]|nr:MAG: thiamine-phosphate kinase [Pseudomonadota bacterium]
MAGEFDLIARYFDWPARGAGVALNVGDDAALLSLKAQHQLAVSVDTLVAGVHFPLDTPPADIAHKALAVNISDMAAMGAEPRWFTLALTLENDNPQWLAAFSTGLKEAATQYAVDLVGGDTTRGAQTITIQVMGEIEPEKALKRSSAQVGDVIFVTNTLGDGAAGLAVHHAMQEADWQASPGLSEAQAYCLSRLNRPTARVPESRVIRRFAHAAIDVSDGLLQDLSHILKASAVGATLNTDHLPLSEAVMSLYPKEQCLEFALTGGDDYELLFTVAREQCTAFQAEMISHGLRCQAIGAINEQSEKITDQQGRLLSASGFQHF